MVVGGPKDFLVRLGVDSRAVLTLAPMGGKADASLWKPGMPYPLRQLVRLLGAGSQWPRHRHSRTRPILAVGDGVPVFVPQDLGHLARLQCRHHGREAITDLKFQIMICPVLLIDDVNNDFHGDGVD